MSDMQNAAVSFELKARRDGRFEIQVILPRAYPTVICSFETEHDAKCWVEQLLEREAAARLSPDQPQAREARAPRPLARSLETV